MPADYDPIPRDLRPSDDADWQEVPFAMSPRPQPQVALDRARIAADVMNTIQLPTEGILSPDQVESLIDQYIRHYPEAATGNEDTLLADTLSFLRQNYRDRFRIEDYYNAMRHCGYAVETPDIPYAAIIRPHSFGIAERKAEEAMGKPARGEKLTKEQVRSAVDAYIEYSPYPVTDKESLNAVRATALELLYRRYNIDDKDIPFEHPGKFNAFKVMPYAQIEERAINALEDSGKGNLTAVQVLKILETYIGQYPYPPQNRRLETLDHFIGDCLDFMQKYYRGRYDIETVFAALERLGHPANPVLTGDMRQMRRVIGKTRPNYIRTHDLIDRWEGAGEEKRTRQELLTEAYGRTGAIRDFACRLYERTLSPRLIDRDHVPDITVSSVELALEMEGIRIDRDAKGRQTAIYDAQNDIVYEIDKDGMEPINLRRISAAHTGKRAA